MLFFSHLKGWERTQKLKHKPKVKIMSSKFPVTANTTAAIEDFAGLATQNRVPEAGGAVGGYLKFSGKTGRWEMGTEAEDFEGVTLFINVLESQHGFIRWGTKEPAKSHSKITQALPQPPAPFDGVDEKGNPKTFYGQASRIISGVTFDDDEDGVIIEVGSMGGVERVDELLNQVMAKAAGSKYFFPVVTLGHDFYKRSTGKVFKPVFTVVEWRNVEGDLEGAKIEAPKTRTKKAAPVVEDDDDLPPLGYIDEEEEEAVEAPVKKRRRSRA
jgi:hypothetical protein